MQDSDYEDFAKLWGSAWEACGKTITPMAVQLAFSLLRDYALEDVARAVFQHLRNPDTGQFAPKPADVIRMLQGSSEDRSMQAWSKVDRAVRTVGPYRSVAFDDPLIHRVIAEMGGWIAFGGKSENDWPFVANEFRNRYRGYAARGVTPDYPPYLVGIAEMENRGNGLVHRESIVLIGDRHKVRQVLAGGNCRNAAAALVSVSHLEVAGLGA